MPRVKSKRSAHVLSLEEFAGDFDFPRYSALAEAEAQQQSTAPGGRGAHTPRGKQVADPLILERETKARLKREEIKIS